MLTCEGRNKEGNEGGNENRNTGSNNDRHEEYYMQKLLKLGEQYNSVEFLWCTTPCYSKVYNTTLYYAEGYHIILHYPMPY